MRSVHIYTCSADAHECRLDSDLSFAQLLWRRSNIVLDPDIFLSVISCGAHNFCSVDSLLQNIQSIPIIVGVGHQLSVDSQHRVSINL